MALGRVMGNLVVGLRDLWRLVGLWNWVGLGGRFVDLRMLLEILALEHGFLFLSTWLEERKLVF